MLRDFSTNVARLEASVSATHVGGQISSDYFTALITISTRASLKRYHTNTLTLGLPPDSASPSSDEGDGAIGEGYTYSIQRIGTAAEKQSVEKELAELRERLSTVEEWKRRRKEIDDELKQVLVQGGGAVAPPAYEETEASREQVTFVEGEHNSSRGGFELGG